MANFGRYMRSARHHSPTRQRSHKRNGRGYRPNVGIVVHNDHGQVFWARRVGGLDEWQFPQGGINRGESAEQALYRELREETGLSADSVEVRACTRRWLRYRTPGKPRGGYLGQEQKWFLLRLLTSDDAFRTDVTEKPEFDAWRWVSYWYPVNKVVAFKRDVYRRALHELAPALRVVEP